jgi:SAM-dependent methyltransferase
VGRPRDYEAERAIGSEITLGPWQPACSCGQDLTPILSPLAEGPIDDPSLETGRAGWNRPRRDGEGRRPITRYEQQQYAAQLKASPNRAALASEAGDAFAHYLRTDVSGARPVPHELLESWIGRGLLERVTIPEHRAATVSGLVLDPFCGSGTTLAVAIEEGRRGLGIELNPEYIKLARDRIGAAQPCLEMT